MSSTICKAILVGVMAAGISVVGGAAPASAGCVDDYLADQTATTPPLDPKGIVVMGPGPSVTIDGSSVVATVEYAEQIAESEISRAQVLIDCVK